MFGEEVQCAVGPGTDLHVAVIESDAQEAVRKPDARDRLDGTSVTVR
jgi:hypothetical protein